MERHAGVDQLRRLIDAVAAIGGDLDLPVVLERIITTAVELVDATYGALGVLDAEGKHLSQFITVGLDAEQRRAIGALPEGHGILGLLIVEPEPIRLPDLAKHPDSFGFPPNHPPMHSFLGVPLFIRGEVYGNLYLTDKRGQEAFSQSDQELAMGLATSAAVAIDNARLHARVREVDLVQDRERIARDLHDTVIQRLFATGLSLQGVVRLVDRPEAVDRIEQAIDDLDGTVREIRSAIFGLQEHRTIARSLRRDLLAVGTELTDALGFEPAFRFEGPIDTLVTSAVAVHVVSVVREGLANVARHAEATRADVLVQVDGDDLTVAVADDGHGPRVDEVGGRGLGNLADRAVELGGAATFAGRPGGGALLSWVVPLG